MKITIDTDELTRRLERLADNAARRVRAASERAAPVAEETLKRAEARADSLMQKFNAVRQRIEDRAAGFSSNSKSGSAPAPEAKSTANSENPSASGQTDRCSEDFSENPGSPPEDPADFPEAAESHASDRDDAVIEFDRMGVDREDSLTSHGKTLRFSPSTTATELLAALIPLLPARKSTCWVVRGRHAGEESLSEALGCVLCDEGLNMKPVSFVGEATVGELKIDKAVGIFRTGIVFRLGTPEELQAMEAARG